MMSWSSMSARPINDVIRFNSVSGLCGVKWESRFGRSIAINAFRYGISSITDSSRAVWVCLDCKERGQFIRYMIWSYHYCDVIMGAKASQITSLTIVYSTVYSGTDQRKHQIPASLAFVRGIHRSLVNSPHKGPVTQKMIQLDDVIMWKYIPEQSRYILLNYIMRYRSFTEHRCINWWILSCVTLYIEAWKYYHGIL